MHYYQFNIGDYSSHTSRLSLMEDLAYRRLLDLYYLSERPFSECLTSVAREIGMSDHKEEIGYILNKFFTLTDGLWVQTRADKEIKIYQSKRKQQSKAGKASAEARKIKACEQTSNERSTDVQPNIKHKPLNTKHNKDIYQQVADEFNLILPALGQVKVLSNKRKAWIESSIKQMNKTESDFSKLETWTRYFNYVSGVDFLMGRKTDFNASFDFLVNKNNLLKVVEGNYDN